MTKPASTTGAGLRDVVAAPSSICFIDGEKGILVYRGYNIQELAEHSTFEEVVYLLWNGRLPKRGELQELNAALVASRLHPGTLVLAADTVVVGANGRLMGKPADAAEDVAQETWLGWGNAPEHLLMTDEMQQLIRAAITTLPARQSIVISMRDLQGWSADDC